ncbi:phosphoribosylamine--glycine ligase [Hydrogenispora ethanolica]|uniref:Phosphoribosylamine--glycine ligase n=1 Tax=Hydrogenispora ethanolica TaxID=1082276 RepID=A0A4R1QU09_HYDET|nr:phosphoribosylamine--glycine ligase [Hydrogenispora ethanolica]TCL54394.1 phosphoribosylamine--glycine ligase [Hydrogenispora ethanolica]
MKVMVIGGGGREHALAWKLSQSPLVTHIYCVPGNAGTAQFAENVTIDSIVGMAEFAAENQVGLTVVGPDAYLADGTVDIFQRKGLLVYGPTQAAARLESSKVFAKAFMQRHGIPTARHQSFTDPVAARRYIEQIGAPAVIKADGLAAGKGVVVAMDLSTALQAVERMMNDRIFGESGSAIVVEEYMEGEEVSLLAFCDGNRAVPMLSAQDHKRIGDHDTGPNTGGMGTYSPTAAYTPDVAERVVREILNPTIQAMRQEGTPFVGTLFLGLMLTQSGPKVVEYNVRFGDPETQVVLPLLESDLAQIFLDAIAGKLDPDKIHWRSSQYAVCVVAAAPGYPGTYPTGLPINGLERVADSLVFHAGTKTTAEGRVLTAGGRVLNVVHLGDSIREAVDGVYRDLSRIHFDGIYYRKDIAWRELGRSE